MLLRRNSNDESLAQLASTGDTVSSQCGVCTDTAVPLRSPRRCQCMHLSVLVRMEKKKKSAHELGHMSVYVLDPRLKKNDV